MATPFSVTLWSTTSTNPAPLCIVHWRTARPWRLRKVGELSAWVAVRMGRPRNRIVLDQCCWPRSSPLPGHEGSSESTTVGKHESAVPFVDALRFRVASRQADARRGRECATTRASAVLSPRGKRTHGCDVDAAPRSSGKRVAGNVGEQTFGGSPLPFSVSRPGLFGHLVLRSAAGTACGRERRRQRHSSRANSIASVSSSEPGMRAVVSQAGATDWQATGLLRRRCPR